MDNLEPKKLALLRILQIFQQYSDYKHPLTQEKITEYLEKDYGMKLERKAVSRNISFLKEAGYEIESVKDGSYLKENLFTETEIRFLADGILASNFIPKKYAKDLINKLKKLSNVYFKSWDKYIYNITQRHRHDNKSLFLNIELIIDAIERKRTINVDINKYGIDKKLHKSYSLDVTPCAIFINEQEYFLLFIWNLENDESKEPYPIIWTMPLWSMSNIIINEDEKAYDFRKLETFKNGTNVSEFLKNHNPGNNGGLFVEDNSKIIKVTFACPDQYIGKALKHFGEDISIQKIPVINSKKLEKDEGWKTGELREQLVKIVAETTEGSAIRFMDDVGSYASIIHPKELNERYNNILKTRQTFNKELAELIK